MSATHSDAYDSPREARPTLGDNVRTILAGWCRAARSTSGAQRVRALIFFAEQSWEFHWMGDTLYRVITDKESRPPTSNEWEMLNRAIAYGWLLVYLMEGEGQEACVLHQIGTLVPVQMQRLEDLPLLLQKMGSLKVVQRFHLSRDQNQWKEQLCGALLNPPHRILYWITGQTAQALRQ